MIHVNLHFHHIFNIPGDNKNIENTITPSTADITSNAIQMPLQLRFSVDDIAIS